MKRLRLMMIVLASAAAEFGLADNIEITCRPVNGWFMAFHRTDGGGNFVVLLFNDADVGVDVRPTFAPGLAAQAQVTCSALGPLAGHQLTVSGFFTP